MRTLKSHPLLKLVNSYLIDASQPSNISYAWNFGSLLLICLIIQIITGVTLAMHYSPNVLEAFNSIEHIMRDVNNGWLIRYLHSNTASAFFFLVYFHIGRGLYYGSYRAPRTLVWVLGTVIFILMIVTAFLGYKRSPKWFNIKVYKSLETQSLTFASQKLLISSITKNPTHINRDGVRYYSTISYLPQVNLSNKLTIIIKELELNPIYVFDNLRLETIKKDILKYTSGLSGIYMIINKTTEDYYIGSAATDRFYARFSNHLIYFKGSKVVKAAVKKYGLMRCIHAINFSFLILELYPNIVTKENNK